MTKAKCGNIVTNIKEFKEAYTNFQNYKPTKVAKELIHEFHLGLSIHFIDIGICSWSATITPLKKSYKFQRA